MLKHFIPLLVGLFIVVYLWICAFLWSRLQKFIYRYTDVDEIGAGLLATATLTAPGFTLLLSLIDLWKS